jgi:serine/threonine protein kinase
MLDYTNASLHFKPLTNIGDEGRNSEVFTAHDYQLDAVIVVKKIAKSKFENAADFFNEAKILYSSAHANIVPIQYACHDEDHVYITMPVFESGSLNKLIDKRFLKLSEIIRYSIDFLSGLHHIHSKRLIHCDVKLNNILISPTDDATLTDFGLSKYLNQDGFAEGQEFYYWHQAPENFQSEKITHQTDIYQAGLTIYRMCNGNRQFINQLKPFLTTGEFDETLFEKAVLSEKFPDRTKYALHIPQRLRNYIRKALAVDPADRYESVLDLLNDLAGLEIPFDWQFTPSADAYQWECETEGKTYRITVSQLDADHSSITTTKHRNKEQQIKEYTRKKVKSDEALKLAKDALHNKNL